MSYVKSIAYGNNLELYNYEANIKFNGRGGGQVQSRVRLSSVAPNGDTEDNSDEGQESQEEKRRRRDNQRRSSMAFRRLVIANLGITDPPVLITCTYAENQSDLRIAYEDWQSFTRTLRNRYGKSFKYIAVPEFQKRGAIHFHALVWGLPTDLYQTERRTRLVASFWRRGFIDMKQTDGKEEIAGYLSKYMSKSQNDMRLSGSQAYRASRNITRPEVDKDTLLLYVEYKYELVDKVPLIDKTFMTQWLGKGRFRLFKVNKT